MRAVAWPRALRYLVRAGTRSASKRSDRTISVAHFTGPVVYSRGYFVSCTHPQKSKGGDENARVVALGTNPARPPPPQRRGPAARKRLDSGARTCRGNTDIANTTYKTAAACPWLVRAAPFCAKTRVLHSASAAACRGTTPRGTHYPWCDKAHRATQVPLFALHATTSNSARARFGSWWRKCRRLTRTSQSILLLAGLSLQIGLCASPKSPPKPTQAPNAHLQPCTPAMARAVYGSLVRL